MFLCIHLDDFKKENILINNKIRNNIITNSYFYRLYYSNNNFISNGIVLCFNLMDIQVEKYFNKNKLIFNKSLNSNIIKKINKIELDLLSSLNIEKKEMKCLIGEQLINGYIKIINEYLEKTNKNVTLIIKISGLWESKTDYGLTFRCMKAKKKYN